MVHLETLKVHQKEIIILKWSYKIFNAERKKIEINFPNDHVIARNEGFKKPSREQR